MALASTTSLSGLFEVGNDGFFAETAGPDHPPNRGRHRVEDLPPDIQRDDRARRRHEEPDDLAPTRHEDHLRGTSSSRDAPRVKSRYNRRMAAAIVVTESVRVPEHALQVRAARASGPGGQNVNKVATKIELRVDLGAIEGLSDAARARLGTLSRGRLDADGRLMVTSQATRTQARNLEDAREKVRTLIAAALREPRRRRKSRPPAGAMERRLEVKKHRGALKRGRARLEE